jgi:hypothetical protein
MLTGLNLSKVEIFFSDNEYRNTVVDQIFIDYFVTDSNQNMLQYKSKRRNLKHKTNLIPTHTIN